MTIRKLVFAGCATAALIATLPAFAHEKLTINFVAKVAGQPFSCAATYAGVGASAAAIKVTDFRMFVSDPKLIRADGSLEPVVLEQDGKWQYKNVALLDFEDGTTGCSGTGNSALNTSLRGEAEEGRYVGIRFTIGVPFDLNHVDPTLAPAPLNTTAMFWSWQGGYKFVRVDISPDGAGMAAAMPAQPQAAAGGVPAGHTTEAAIGMHGSANGWFLHLGSTECTSASQTEAPRGCANPNRTTVTFADFNLSNNVVVIDPAAVLAGADLRVNAPDTAPGCMSSLGDRDCLTVMARLGVPYADLPAGEQLLAKVQ